MGRPPSLGRSPPFRFLPNEIAKMEKIWKGCRGSIPSEKVLLSLVKKFRFKRVMEDEYMFSRSFSVERKQVIHWFQKRKSCAQKKEAAKMTESLLDKYLRRAEASSSATSSDEMDITKMEFEAKSSTDGAWYDVQMFVAHRMLDSGNPEVRVRFVGYGADDEEWVDVRTAVRQRSVPCEDSECISIQPGDLVLGFLEGDKQALYYDAYVVDIERRRHDIRGCRCRFVVQYEHNDSMDLLPLKRLCRRPESGDQSALDFSGAANTASSKQNSELCDG